MRVPRMYYVIDGALLSGIVVFWELSRTDLG